MTHSFLAVIDESGDDGIGKFKDVGRGGATKWLVISACLIRATNDLETVKWRDEINDLMPDRKSRNLHFKDLNHGQKLAAVKILAKKPIRIINIYCNKTALSGGNYSEKNRLYFHLTRFLIERISWACRDMRPRVPEGDGRVKIVFSRRGGLSYDDFRSYMELLKSTIQRDIQIHWPVIDIAGISAMDHSRSASLQLVDVAASSFAAAFEPDRYGNCVKEFATILKHTVYNKKGNFLSYGMKFHPKHTDFSVTEEQQSALDMFGDERPPGP